MTGRTNVEPPSSERDAGIRPLESFVEGVDYLPAPPDDEWPDHCGERMFYNGRRFACARCPHEVWVIARPDGDTTNVEPDGMRRHGVVIQTTRHRAPTSKVAPPVQSPSKEPDGGPEPCLTARVESAAYSGLSFVWVAYGSSGYRITLPSELAARLVEAVSDH